MILDYTFSDVVELLFKLALSPFLFSESHGFLQDMFRFFGP